MKEIKTRISTVTVFRDGVRVVRNGKTELSPGEQIVKISGITCYAEADSFRVKGKGKAVLRGIDVKRVSRTFEPEGDVKDLVEKLKELKKEQAVAEDEILLQKRRIERLNVVLNQFSTEFGKWYSVGESTMDQMARIDKTGTMLVMDSKKRMRQSEADLEKILSEISALQDNINRIQGQRRTETFNDVYVSLDAKESTPLELEVVYQLRLASWRPTYDVDIGDEKASIKRIAVIQNQTLEDWEDVNLTVSTASAQPVEAVEPNPFYIDVYSPQYFGAVASGSAAAPRAMKKEKDYEEFDDELLLEAAEEPVPEIIEEFAETSETLGGITVYDVPGEVTIPADNDPHPVTLTLEEFDSRRLHYWNAAAMSEVVAQDEITNRDTVLLPGNVKVYAAGDFVGETYIALQAPREKFRLGTRVAYDVKAEKKLIEKETEKAGITRGRKKRGYKYSLEIQSFAKQEIEVKVVDVIPYSNSEKITVELSEPSLSYKKMELGVIEWEVSIEAGVKNKIEYSYEVEWEKDVVVTPPLP
jgi:uncharacterized protein (TIGR02231 family)